MTLRQSVTPRGISRSVDLQEVEGGVQWPEQANCQKQQTFSERCGSSKRNEVVEMIEYQGRSSPGDGFDDQVLPAQ